MKLEVARKLVGLSFEAARNRFNFEEHKHFGYRWKKGDKIRVDGCISHRDGSECIIVSTDQNTDWEEIPLHRVAMELSIYACEIPSTKHAVGNRRRAVVV